MKFLNNSGLIFIVFVLICLSCVVWAQDGDVKRAAPRRPIGKSSKTTTTPAPAEDDAEYPDGDNPDQYGEEGEEAVAPSSTTTEAPKKIGPVIRPFRSNDDFLNSLKRRQMDAKKNRAERLEHKSKPHAEQKSDDSEQTPVAAPVAAKSLKSTHGNTATANRRKFTKNAKPEQQPEDTAAAAEGSEQDEKEETKPKRPPHPRLALKKRV